MALKKIQIKKTDLKYIQGVVEIPPTFLNCHLHSTSELRQMVIIALSS